LGLLQRKHREGKLHSLFTGLFDNQGTLLQKATRGSIWVLMSFALRRVFYFARTIILVRLLAPTDFGIMSIALLSLGVVAVFTETGIGTAIIQKKGNNRDILNTAWSISVLRGFFLFGLLYLLSPAIANFYDNPSIQPILKVVAFTFLLSGLTNMGVILLQKELDFKKKILYDQVTNVSNIVFAIIFAFILKSVWALILGHVIGTLVGLIFSYVVHPFRPSFKLDIRIAKDLFRFGKHVFAMGIFMFLITRGDDALVGKILGLGALGFYALAYNLSNIPATAITHVISQVSFPAYSKAQDDLEKLKRGYLKVLKFTSILVVPLAAGLFILAPDFIRIVYGERWVSMIPAVLVMSFLGLFRAISATMGPIFLAVGKPYILNRIKLSEFALMAVIIYPLTKALGIVGASIAGTLVYLLSLILHYHNLIHILKGIKIEILNIVGKHMIAAVLMGLGIYIIKSFVFIEVNLLHLILLILFGAAFYCGFNLIIDKSLIKSTREILLSITTS